jgi:restriction system protein
MSLPSYQELMLPVLRVLQAAGAEIHHRDCAVRTADSLDLTEEQRNATLPSGNQTYLYNRVGWASWYMQQAGLLEKVRRGYWKITEEGRKLLGTHPTTINNGVLSQYPRFVERIRRKSDDDGGETNGEAGSYASPVKAPDAAETTPDEQIEQAYQQLNRTLASDLRDQMAKMDPFRFEQLVVDLLFAMGYGGSREEAASVTRKTNDEGIDGIINEDRLGLDVIYIQAKRWQSTVGRVELQNFVGALAGKQAHKGVFITTSEFNRNAVEYARAVPQKIILIDGVRLADLMIEHNIGVTTVRTVALKRIDSDYFEQG